MVRLGQPLKVSFHPAFVEVRDLCPVDCLKEYEARTSQWRPSNPSSPNKLFLSFVAPHKPVSRWVRSVLSASGIDTSVFQCHSVRGASTSTAAQSGVTLAQILEMADWSGERTFLKFYYRPQFDPTAGRAVLKR